MKQSKKVVATIAASLLGGLAANSTVSAVQAAGSTQSNVTNVATTTTPTATTNPTPVKTAVVDKTVKVMADSLVYYLLDSGFQKTSKWISTSTVFTVNKAITATDGRTYYLLMENNKPVIWITEQRTTTITNGGGTTAPTDPGSSSVTAFKSTIKIQYKAGYGINLWNTYLSSRKFLGRRLAHNTTWKTYYKATIGNSTWYNLGGNQWIDGQYATVVDGSTGNNGGTTTPPITTAIKPKVTYAVNKSVKVLADSLFYYLTDKGFVYGTPKVSTTTVYQVKTETLATDGRTYDLLLENGKPIVWITQQRTTEVTNQGTVTIKLVDGNNQVLKTASVLTGEVGKTWTYTAPTIDGYYAPTSTLTGTYTAAATSKKVVYYQIIPNP